MKQTWRIWVTNSLESTRMDSITTTKQSTTKLGPFYGIYMYFIPRACIHYVDRKISWGLEATRFRFRIFQSLWNLKGTSAELLSNFKAIQSLWIQARNFKTSWYLAVRHLTTWWIEAQKEPASEYQPCSLCIKSNIEITKEEGMNHTNITCQ